MDYEKAKQLLEELKKLKQEDEKLSKEYCTVCKDDVYITDENGNIDVIRKNPKDYERISEIYRQASRALMKAEENFLKYIKDLEIKNPENIIGARMTKGYDGKVDVFEVTDLLHLPLSEKKQEGTIYMPYKIGLDGIATRTIKTNTYKIRRVDNKVYLIPKKEDFIDLWN